MNRVRSRVRRSGGSSAMRSFSICCVSRWMRRCSGPAAGVDAAATDVQLQRPASARGTPGLCAPERAWGARPRRAASASGMYGPCRAAAASVGRANLNLGDPVQSVLEALRAATAIPARVLGLAAEAGTIEPGRRADLVVLDRDPLADIANVRSTRLVVAAGRVYDAAALRRSVGFAGRDGQR